MQGFCPNILIFPIFILYNNTNIRLYFVTGVQKIHPNAHFRIQNVNDVAILSRPSRADTSPYYSGNIVRIYHTFNITICGYISIPLKFERAQMDRVLH